MVKTKIIQELKGKINEILVNSEHIFYACEYLLQNWEEKFGAVTEENTKNVINYVTDVYYGSTDMSIQEIGKEVKSFFETSQTVEEVERKLKEI